MANNRAASGEADLPLSNFPFSIYHSSPESPPTQVQLELGHVNTSRSDRAANVKAMEEGKANTTVYVYSNERQTEPQVSRYRKMAAEAISTFFLVFLGCGSIITDKKSDGAVTLIGISLVFGLAIMAMVKAVGHISGAHMNPAITLAFASVRDIPLSLVPFYLVAQVGGAICAGFVLRVMFDYDFDEDLGHLGATSPANNELQALAMELVITLVLMFVVSSVAVDSKAVGELAGLILGATITLCAIVGGTVSGSSMNPARSIGPAVAANWYKGLWVYIVGPTLGAVVGAWLYALLHGPQLLSSESQVRLKPQSNRRHRLWSKHEESRARPGSSVDEGAVNAILSVDLCPDQ